MQTLISIDPDAEVTITTLVSALPGDGLEQITLALAHFADNVRRRLNKLDTPGLDGHSVAAVDYFVSTPGARVLVDMGSFYFKAERGRLGSAISISDVGIYSGTGKLLH